MLNTFKPLALALVATLSFGLTSCGDDEPEIKKEQPEIPIDPETPADNTSTLSEIKSRTQVEVTFANYRFKVKATYTPANNESASFDWIVSRRRANEGSRIDEKKITYSNTMINGKTVFNLEFPFYIYFVLRWNDDEKYEYLVEEWKEKLTESEMYLASYDALNAKEASGETLLNDELQLRKRLISYLNEYLEEAKYDFSLWLYVKVNGKNYNLGERYIY